MSVSYLIPGTSASAESMNDLFSELDNKLAKTFGGGKSFILAADEEAWMQRDHSLVRLLGVPFFFHSGFDCKYINPIARMASLSDPRGAAADSTNPYIDSFPPYDETVFQDALNSLTPYFINDTGFSPFDTEKNIVKVYATDNSYWKDIGYVGEFNNGYRKISSNLFDRSLYIYKLEDRSVEPDFNRLYLESEAIGNVAINFSGTISTVVSGDSATLYSVPVWIKGTTEGKEYIGGDILNGSLYEGGSPVASNANIWRLDISAPSGHYYLNNGTVSTASNIYAFIRVPISGNATMTLSYDTVDGLQINPPNPHWAEIDKPPRSDNGDGYYIQEYLDYYPGSIAQPERNNQYALADILVENRSSIYLPASGNKYDCYRVHNFNEENLLVEIGTGFSYSLTPFECRTFRNFKHGGWNSGYHYFLPYESGDPRFYTSIPAYYTDFAGFVTGFASWDSVYNSYSANNLLNPSILFDWIEAFSTETNPVGNAYYNTYFDGFFGHGRKALIYQDINTAPFDVSLTYSGKYEYPITNNTLIGDLIHHKGDLKIAKVSKTATDASGNLATYFDWITFSGYDTIVSDFATKGITVSLVDGVYQLSNADTANYYFNLFSISTNLLKRGEFIPSMVNIDTPYELESCALDSSYYQDSWYQHISGQKILFQTEKTYDISGGYRTGDFISPIFCNSTTIGDIATGFVGISYSGVTGLSSYGNFSSTLTPFGLYLDFDEAIPAYYQLVPQVDFYSNFSDMRADTDELGNPKNWFGENKCWRNTAIPWTRLQGDWTLDGENLTRKRRIHFRGHGFGWANLKFDRSTLIQSDSLGDLPSFNTLYTSAVHGKRYLREYSHSPISGLDFGGRDFYIYESGFVYNTGIISLTQNTNPYNRQLTTREFYPGYTRDWDRFFNIKQMGFVDSFLEYDEIMFSQLAANYSQFQSASFIEDYITVNNFSGTPYIPLLTEHYNAMAEKVNSCKYARPLSADQWYKTRLRFQINSSPSYVYSTGVIVPIFKFINQGYSYDCYSNDFYNFRYANSIPFNAYGILNRWDRKVDWGGYDIDAPIDVYNWINSNVGISIISSNYQAPITDIVSGSGVYSYYAQSTFISGYDDNFYLYPNYPDILAYNALKNANPEPYPSDNPSVLNPFSGFHYISVEDVSNFFTGMGQHFYWKNSFQPLSWESIKTYTGIYFDFSDSLFSTGLYNNFPYSINYSQTSGETILGGDPYLFPLLETWLSPSSDSPVFKKNRNLHENQYTITDYSDNEEKRNRYLQTYSGVNNFHYAFISGDIDDINSGLYVSSTFGWNDSSKRIWALNRELLNTGNSRFYQLLPIGFSLFSNNENQLRWKILGFKERFEQESESFRFSSLESYAAKQSETLSFNSEDIFELDLLGAGTWTGCQSYLDESYGCNLIIEAHEPIIDI